MAVMDSVLDYLTNLPGNRQFCSDPHVGPKPKFKQLRWRKIVFGPSGFEVVDPDRIIIRTHPLRELQGYWVRAVTRLILWIGDIDVGDCRTHETPARSEWDSRTKTNSPGTFV
jgi:hypothetical protein